VSFSAATAVDKRASCTYAGRIQPGWDIVGNANGGYLLAIAARASAQAAGGRHPVTVTGHFLAPGKPGPVDITTAVERAGRRFSTVRATMSGAGRPILAMLGGFADVPEAADPVERIDSAPPKMPEPDACVPVEPTDTFPPPFMGKVDLRLHPEDATFNTGVPRFRGWFRLREDEPVDAFGLLVAVDAFPPTVFNAHLPVAWTPTLELTAHVRRLPVDGWLQCQFTTRFISDGYLEEDGEVWDQSGRLVAQSRQLALLPKG
jgi:acyl-CoA thioesterase